MFSQETVPKEKLAELLELELKEYEKYVNGEQQFYSYAIYDSNNECVDSCTGFELIDNNFNELVTEIAQHIDDKYKFLTQEMLKKKQVQLEQE
jgi:glutamate racemase